jgi:Tfp pilus assembly protein PilO
MSPLSKNKILILVASGVLITSAILFFLSRDEYGKLQDAKASYNEKQTILANQEKKLAALEQLDKESTEIQQIQASAEGWLPDDLNGSAFVSSIEKLGNRLQVTPLSISVNSTASSVKDKNSAPSYSFSITFNSSFQTLISFLAELEKLERFNSIVNISMSPTDKGLGISLTGYIYQYKTTK